MQVKIAQSEHDWRRCFPVMNQLRPDFDLMSFLNQVEVQAAAGYQIAYVESESEQILAVAGFIVGTKLAWGKHLYVDDLVTDITQRSAGAGKLLLDFLKTLASEQGCGQLHLDSGVQRFNAHRFYLRERMDIGSHHFQIKLT